MAFDCFDTVLSRKVSPEYVFRLWLKELINYFDQIFVSCDYHADKASGRLYKIILQKLKTKASDIIMVGDNVISDYRCAIQLGIKSFHVYRKNIYDFYNAFNQKYIDHKKFLENSVMNSSLTQSKGYVNIAFAFYAFIDNGEVF